ncbi:MAG: TVP38/TMEM64 family protein [Candidatus Kerfeldbacteria bacterium]|nr:TVP38/TMEM64 family protein [Candidatus Kerfeldbacteria bacterium]
MTRIILTWRYTLALVATLIVLGVSYWLLDSLVFSLDVQGFDHWIAQFGVAAPLVMIGLITAEVIIAPLPGGWLAIATGYLFGSVLGSLYAYAGNVIGSYIAFELARIFGQPFVRRFVSETKYARYSAKVSTSKFGLGLLYAIPLFPIDIVSLLLGISGINHKTFFKVMLLGFIPNMLILNFVGAGIAIPEYRFVMLTLVAIVIAYFVWKTLKTNITSSKVQSHPVNTLD